MKRNKRMNQYKLFENSTKGITLIALLVTIIVLMILAGISINLTIGENGIITRANQAKEAMEKTEEQERLELLSLEMAMKDNGKVNLDSYIGELVDKGIVEPDDVQTNPDGSKEVIMDSGYVATIVDKGNGEIEITIDGKADNLPPKIMNVTTKTSSNSIEITVDAKRVDGGKYYYYYKENGTSEGYTKIEESKEATSRVTGLEQGKKYDIKVEVENENGKTEKEVTVTTGSLPEGSITFGGVNWNSSTHKATVTVNTTETGYTLQYATSSSGPWTNIVSGASITEQSLNTTIYARLWDGTNATTHATTTITDGTAPSVSHSISPTGNTGGTVTITLTVTDNQSGVANVTNTTTSNITKNSNTSYTVSKNGTYSFQASDNAGNTTNYSVTISNIGITAAIVAQNPSEYYGKVVTGYNCTNSAGISNWKIFYADNNNVYLIADDYIHYNYAPSSANYSLYRSSDYKMSFVDVYQDYTGSVSITNVKVRSWLKWLNSYGSNTGKNIRSIAYMLDTDAWSVYKGDKAEYAIGGPTLDLFVASYNQLHSDKTIEYRSVEYGYEVKWSTGSSYSNNVSGLNTNESLYVIKSGSKAQGMWLASPCGDSSNYMLQVRNDGWISSDSYSIQGSQSGKSYMGLRPVVCLKSDTRLEKQSDGTYKIK